MRSHRVSNTRPSASETTTLKSRWEISSLERFLSETLKSRWEPLRYRGSLSDHSDVLKLQMRLCLSRPISVYISLLVLRRTLAMAHNIILRWLSRFSRNTFCPPQNCLDFPESPFGPLTECKFFLFSFGSIKDFKQVAESEQIWYFNWSRD